ncbi:MAG TPA: ROK family protein [Polyangia bacterium]|nr:ROK family protein [Polyangia bacterium]
MSFRSSTDRIIGIDLGGTKIFGGLVDPFGHIEHETYVAHGAGPATTDDRVFERLVELVHTLAGEALASGCKVRGVGVGAPGITRADGLVVASAQLGWREMPLQARLTQRLNLPVKVENDVNLSALGELQFGAGRGAQNLVCLFPGTGIGGAVIIDGKLVRGQHDAAGEVGLMLPGPQFLGWRNREWGPLEDIASGTGIAQRGRKAVQDQGLPLPPDGLRAEDVFAAAAEGAAWASAIIEETIDYLAVSIANIQALLDPERIILGGGIASAGDRIIPGIERRLEPVLPTVPLIVRSELGYRAGVFGAAAALSES